MALIIKHVPCGSHFKVLHTCYPIGLWRPALFVAGSSLPSALLPKTPSWCSQPVVPGEKEVPLQWLWDGGALQEWEGHWARGLLVLGSQWEQRLPGKTPECILETAWDNWQWQCLTQRWGKTLVQGQREKGSDGVKEMESRAKQNQTKPCLEPEESSEGEAGKSKMDATDKTFVKISTQTRHLLRR